MSEEIKTGAVELTDEEIENAAGGNELDLNKDTEQNPEANTTEVFNSTRGSAVVEKNGKPLFMC